jgi:probable phosphoglycerate mutase
MTTTFHLVRHARHDRLDHTLCGRMEGVRLGVDGLAEARTVAGRLAHEPLVAIYTSPMERCRQTAEAVAAHHAVAPQLDGAFTEVDFGDWTGLSFEQLQADPRWEPWNSRRSLNRPPGGESLGEAQMRAWRGVEALCARHPDQPVAVVSHSDIIKALVAHLLGVDLDLHHRIAVDPVSVTTLVVGDWGAKLTRLNA